MLQTKAQKQIRHSKNLLKALANFRDFPEITESIDFLMNPDERNVASWMNITKTTSAR